MRFGSSALIMLCMAACAAGPAVAAKKDRQARRCDVSQCFRQRDIRDYQVIDDDTLVVFTGARRCAFVVELRGFQCRLDFATQIAFLRRTPGTIDSRGPFPGQDPTDIFGIDRGGRSPYQPASRVCAYSPRLVVYAGPVDVGSRGPPPGIGEACDVADVRSITDDELLEIYVERHLTPPPPPSGPGELSVAGQDEPSDAETADENADAGAQERQGGAAQEPR
jgi:hypothetical protein